MSQLQIDFLSSQLNKGNVKNKYSVKNKIISLKKQQIKKQIKSFKESYEDFLAK